MNEVKRGPGRPAKEETQVQSGKILAKVVQLGIGVDLLGAALSLQSKKGNELEVTPLGIKATSAKNGRVVLIPWANIRACELLA